MDDGSPLRPDFHYLVKYGLGSVAVYFITFYFLSPFLSNRLTYSYRSLNRTDQNEWHGRVLSTIHAMLCNVLSPCCLLWDEGLSDPIWYDCKLARVSVSCTIGYLLADQFRITFVCRFGFLELLSFTAHHLISVYAYYYVSVYGILCYFAMYRMLCELSNPCLNLRWFFLMSDTPKASKPAIVNGLGLFISFFLCRVATIPKFWHILSSVLSTDSVRSLGHIQYTVMIVPSIVLDTLNVYWFYKICRGVFSLLSKMFSKTAKKGQHLE